MGKKGTYSYSRSLKRKGKRQKMRLKINNPIIDSAWKAGVSVKANFDRIGLAYNPNEVLGIPNRKFFTHESSKPNEKIHKKTKVVEALEEVAQSGKSKPLYVSEDDQLFCIYNIEIHGNDYLAMCRDSKNVYQFTPKQIERLINKFRQTSGYQKYLAEKEEGLFDLSELYPNSVP